MNTQKCLYTSSQTHTQVCLGMRICIDIVCPGEGGCVDMCQRGVHTMCYICVCVLYNWGRREEGVWCNVLFVEGGGGELVERTYQGYIVSEIIVSTQIARTRAEPQQIVAQRLLSCLQYPVSFKSSTKDLT